MSDAETLSSSESSFVFCYGLSDLDQGRVRQCLDDHTRVMILNCFAQIKSQLSLKTSTLVIGLEPKDFQAFMSLIPLLQNAWPSLPIVVLPNNLSVAQVSQLINQAEVLSLVTDHHNWDEILTQAQDEHLRRVQNVENLQLLKIQNQKLESLNKNLEDLVIERTSIDYQASQEAEQSLKEMQQILHFIKKISACDNLEDLMQALGVEFKKFQKSRPPILILRRGSDIRLYYFQGRQLVSKKTDLQLAKPSDQQNYKSEELRQQLSNTFGRPMGHLHTQSLEFQSQELYRSQAIFSFEHAYSDHDLEILSMFAQQRWPIINMALENILLKESLQAIAKQWAKTFNQMQDPILIIDKDYRMSLSNREFHRKSQQTCYQAFANRETPCRDCPLTQTFASGEPQNSDISVDGKIYRAHSYPIHLDERGQVSHVINQYTDITSHVNLRSQVIQGEKMAAVGLLAGNIAHELNNPLTGIHSLSDLLMADFDAETSTFKDLREIKEAAARCQMIIRDLLDFSSLGQDGKVRRLNLNEVIEKTLPLLKVSMRTINTDIELDAQPLWVEGTAQLLQQVIFNLVNNACQAMDEGGTLKIWSRIESGEAVIGVRDTGPGIPESLRAQVFEPFFTTKQTGQGTGLGLSMSRSVVERFGGQLVLNEGYTQGTELIIRLPLVNHEDTHS